MLNAAGIAELRRENALLADRLQALQADCAALKETAASLRDQLDWFKRQLFGRRSEKRLEVDLAEQADLFEALGVDDAPAVPGVPAETTSYRRRRKARGEAVDESGLRFDDIEPQTRSDGTNTERRGVPARAPDGDQLARVADRRQHPEQPRLVDGVVSAARIQSREHPRCGSSARRCRIARVGRPFAGRYKARITSSSVPARIGAEWNRTRNPTRTRVQAKAGLAAIRSERTLTESRSSPD